MFLFWISQWYDRMPEEDDIQHLYVMYTMINRRAYWSWLRKRTNFALTF